MSNLQHSSKLTDQCQDPPYNGYNLTNRVLVEQIVQNKSNRSKKDISYYCPAYVRIKVKNFSQMSLSDLSATINMVIILTVKLQNIPDLIAEQIISKMVLWFNRDASISLGKQSQEIKKNHDKHKGTCTFTIRKLLHAGMDAQIFLSPFEIINLIFTANVRQVDLTRHNISSIINKAENDKDQLDETKKKQIKYFEDVNSVTVYFNCMDLKSDGRVQEDISQYVKISYTEQGTFGNYDLAQRRLKTQYTNNELHPTVLKNKKKNNQALQNHGQINSFQYAHFQIPLYKFPMVTITTIFVPLWLLAIINLGIFFQNTGLSDRIGSIAALMIAYVALIPVIRQALPPNPNITLVQILVYLQATTTLFCFIQSVAFSINDGYQFLPFQNGLFLASIIIGIAQIVTVFVLIMLHYCLWERGYNRRVYGNQQISFDYRKWANKDCDDHFRRKLDNQTIRLMKNINKQKKKY